MLLLILKTLQYNKGPFQEGGTKRSWSDRLQAD